MRVLPIVSNKTSKIQQNCNKKNNCLQKVI